MVVDFPAPLGPRKPVIEPGMMSIQTFLIAAFWPNFLVRFFVRMAPIWVYNKG